jgi:hypothetical protein
MDLYSERRMHAGFPRSIGWLNRSLDPGETASSFMNHFMLWRIIELQAKHLRLGTRNCAYGEWERLGVCTPGERGARIVVFEVKPVVAVLQAENVKLVIVVGVTAQAKIDIEIDQPALDREQTANKCLLTVVFGNRIGKRGTWSKILELVRQIKPLASYYIVFRWRPDGRISWPCKDVEPIEFAAAGKWQCVCCCLGTVGPLDLLVVHHVGEFPALDRRFAVCGDDESGDTRFLR